MMRTLHNKLNALQEMLDKSREEYKTNYSMELLKAIIKLECDITKEVENVNNKIKDLKENGR